MFLSSNQFAAAKELPTNQIKFSHFDTSDGLPQNTILAIQQDKEGFVWIGTQSGLIRFDGYRINNYKHNPLDEKSLSSNLVTAITTDDEGRIWSAVFPTAINLLNPKDGRFSKINIPTSNSISYINVALAQGDNIWITNENKFFVINQSTLQIEPFQTETKQNELAITILKQNSSSVWLVKQSGMFQVNNNKIIDSIFFDFDADEEISSIDLHESTFYIATTTGKIYKYNLQEKVLNNIFSIEQNPEINSKFSNSSTVINKIVFHKNNLWLATDSRGLIKYSISEKKTSSYHHNSNQLNSLSDNKLHTLMFDNSGLLWIGTASSGFDRTTTQKSNFTNYYDESNINSFAADNNINYILKTKNQEYWVTNNSGELKQLHPKTSSFSTYPLPNAKQPTKNNFTPAAILELNNGNILYGSRFGLWEFNRELKRYKQISTIDYNGVNASSILSIFQDNKQRIWLGSAQKGIGLYDQTNHQIVWYPAKNNQQNVSSNFIINIEDAGKDLLWLGTSKGLFLFDTKKLEYKLPSFKQNSELLKEKLIRTFYQPSKGKLWVGTLSGVYLIEADGEQWNISVPFNHIDSLTNNIYAFAKEKENLWISSSSGITRINLKSLNNKIYQSQDGLQGEEFNGNAVLKEDMAIWFGGVNGITKFNPAIIQDNKFLPPIWITGYQIDENFYTVHNPAFFNSVVVPANSRLLRLEFSSLDYNYSKQNKYRIVNRENQNDWIDLGNRNELIYSQLKPGTFNICIQGSNHDGIWNPNCRSLTITVKANLWESNIAYLFYFIGSCLIIFWIYYLRRQHFNSSQKILNELKESQQQLNWSLQGSGDALWIWDIKSNSATRRGINRLLGYQPGEIYEPHSNLDSLIHPDDLNKTKKAISAHIHSVSQKHFEVEYRMKAASGDWVWILDRGQIVNFDANGKPEKAAGTFRDITHRKKISEEQALSALIIRNMAEMVLITDANSRIISANPSWCHKMGYQLHEIIGKNPAILNSPNQEPEFYNSIQEHLIRFGSWQGEVLQTRKNSQDLLAYQELTIVKDVDQNVLHFVSVATDITEKKKAEDELRYLANYDMLTNLPNRTLFLDRLEHSILQAQRNQNSIALLFIDLDNFKNINDSLGHNYGDLLLKEAAQLISQCVRKDDTVSRLGGDEFTVILENISDSISVLQIAEKIINIFKNTIQIAERLVTSTPSIGISLYPDDASNASSLVKFADTAMYFAKSQGKNNFQYYSESMNKNALRRLDLESHLRGALENQEFHLLYQPKVSAKSGKITGMEALLRWNNSVVGNVTPDEFIPLAEDTGLIVPIGNWVLNEACKQAKTWLDKGFDKLEIAVNLSFRQFKNSNLVQIVAETLKQTGLPGNHLTLEITESLLMDNIAMATEQLEQLKQLGLKIAIDDFGTGYSSLNYLKQFPLDYLKIDRTFVRDILTDQNDASLTSAIVALSHNLNLTVIAEGVELFEQLEFLKKTGCEEIQGFLVSPPISHYEFATLLEDTIDKNIFTLLKQDS